MDMERLKKDYKFNDVSDRSFFYLDLEFFKASPQQQYKDKEESPQKEEKPLEIKQKEDNLEEEKKEVPTDFAELSKQLTKRL